MGTRLEPLIADKFASEHPEHRWALGNLDRMIICPNRGRGILEIKTASEYLRQENQECPEYSQVTLVNTEQVIHEKVFIIDDGTHCTMLLAEEY